MPPSATWRTEAGQDRLYLGEIIVGRVMSNGGRNDKPRWIFALSGYVSTWRTERTLAHARLAVELQLADWLRRAGLAA